MRTSYAIPATEDDWLALRREGIGSSDVAALFGCSPYVSAYQLWADKAGLAAHRVQETEAMAWGKALEPVIAERYARTTGHRIERCVRAIYWDPERPHLRASPDAILDYEDGRKGILEIKVASSFAEGWDEDLPPLHYRLQIAHQMLVTDAAKGAIACFDAGQLRLKIWDCIRIPELEAEIVERCDEFWGRVLAARKLLAGGDLGSGRMREIELSLGPGARDLATIQAVHRGGKAVADLTEHEDLLIDWTGASGLASRLERIADDAKARALVQAGEADTVMADGRIVAKRTKTGSWRVQPDYRERATAMFEARRETQPQRQP